MSTIEITRPVRISLMLICGLLTLGSIETVQGQVQGQHALLSTVASDDETPVSTSEIPQLTFAGLRDISDVLPDDIAMVDGLHLISIQAHTIYSEPTLYGFAPALTEKAVVSLVQGDEAPGSVLIFEYEEELSHDARDFLTGMLWGEGGRSPEHPEEVIFSGRFTLILSFQPGTHAGEWYKARLRSRFHLSAPRSWDHIAKTMDDMFAAYLAQDTEGARKVLLKAGETIDDYAMAQFMLAECSRGPRQAKAAVKAYSRAIELHESFSDRLPSEMMLFSCLDGLGIALLTDNKNKDAVIALADALTVGDQLDMGPMLAGTFYNLACGYARLRRYPDCHQALATSFELAAWCRDSAEDDSDLRKVKQRKDFRDLFGD